MTTARSQTDGLPLVAGLIMMVLMSQAAAVSLRSTPLFWMLLLVVMVERLTSAATEVSVERDCIPEFSGEPLVHGSDP